jgi:aminopeptidase N
VADRWADDLSRENLLFSIAEACLPLSERGGSTALVALRTLALVAVTDEHFAALESDDLELQWRRQTRLSELGRHDAQAVAALQKRDPDPESWAHGVIAETAQPNAEAKAGGWRVAMEEMRFPIGYISHLGRAFWRPEQDDLVAPYADRYLDALLEFGDGGMLAAAAVAATLFPVVGVGEEFFERALATAENPDLSPMLSTVVIDHADLLRRMLASRRRSQSESPAEASA